MQLLVANELKNLKRNLNLLTAMHAQSNVLDYEFMWYRSSLLPTITTFKVDNELMDSMSIGKYALRCKHYQFFASMVVNQVFSKNACKKFLRETSVPGSLKDVIDKFLEDK